MTNRGHGGYLQILVLVLGGILLLPAGPAGAAPQENPGIAPIDSRPHGKSYSEWAAQWWQWALKAPTSANPVTDETGAHCANGQAGSVWFLAGTFGGSAHRECVVPTGTALFFPLANVMWAQWLTDPPYNSIDDLRAIIKPYADGAVFTVEIDGRPIKRPTSYREQSAVFTSALPAQDNLWGITANECPLGAGGMLECAPSVDDGYYLFVNPLPAGEHTIHFTAMLPNYTPPFALDVTYTLHVRK